MNTPDLEHYYLIKHELERLLESNGDAPGSWEAKNQLRAVEAFAEQQFNSAVQNATNMLYSINSMLEAVSKPEKDAHPNSRDEISQKLALFRESETEGIRNKYLAVDRIFNGESATRVAADLGKSQHAIGETFRRVCNNLNSELYMEVKGDKSGVPRIKDLVARKEEFLG